MEYDKVEVSRASVPSKQRVKLLSLDNLKSAYHLVMIDFFLESETTEGTTDCAKEGATPFPEVSYPERTCGFMVYFLKWYLLCGYS